MKFSLFTVFLLVGLKTSVAVAVTNTTPGPATMGDICQDCIQILQLIGDMLGNPELQKDLLKILTTVCDTMPKTAAVCHKAVEDYLPIVLNFLHNIDNNKACAVLGLCGSKLVEHPQKVCPILEALKAAMLDPEVDSLTPCSFCKYLIHLLEGMLPKEKTEAAVLALLGEVCSILPSSLEKECVSLIDRYGKELVDKLLQSASPETICTFIHMCKKQEAMAALKTRNQL